MKVLGLECWVLSAEMLVGLFCLVQKGLGGCSQPFGMLNILVVLLPDHHELDTAVLGATVFGIV